MVGMGAQPSSDPVVDLLATARFAVPDHIPGLVAEHARRLGALDAAIFLIDYEQRILNPLPQEGGPDRQSVGVEGTLAGRAFSTVSVHWSAESAVLWVPMVEGNERLGVLGFEMPRTDEPPDDFTHAAVLLTAQAAELVATKADYGDFFEIHRRGKPMSLASELLWQLLPPLTFGTENATISGLLAPPYDLGGDTFDYGVDDERARIAVFDAMGHGLEAAAMATVVTAAYRHGRRGDLPLAELYGGMDDVVARVFPGRFATAQLGRLDTDRGELSYVNAGHPAALWLRKSQVIAELPGPTARPLGLRGDPPRVETVQLEPGDRLLLYTDGVTDALGATERFGEQRLIETFRGISREVEELGAELLRAVDEFRTAAQVDDIAMVGIERRRPVPVLEPDRVAA